MFTRTVTAIVIAMLLTSTLTLAFNIQPVKAEPRTWYVDDSGGKDFTRIQDAIYAASPGDTIYVYNGTYHENVIVDKALSLIGENKESTIIDGNSLSHVVDLKANSIYMSGFTIQNGVSGILADHTNYHTIENNIVQNSNYGIYLQDSQNNRLNDNLIIDNNYGLHIDNSGSNALKRNAMNNNCYNFYLFLLGWLYDFEFVQDIDTSNTVNGKPIYWWMHESNRQVPTDAGYVVIVGSTNILIKDLELTKNGQGIVLLGTFNSIIENVTLLENERGVSIHGFARYNNIRSNRITNNGDGITVEESRYNIIERNSIDNNGRGIVTVWGFSNRFYHNNIIDNTIQVDNPEDFYSINYWDDGYPSGGNYWSDYVGVDVRSGPNQDQPGSDVMDDMPYIIDADNRDRYPLMNPYGTPPPPAYALTITTTVGGTTNPTPGTYSYTANSAVQVTAIPNTGYLFEYWELDSVNVGSANPYSVYMDKDHMLKTIFSPIPPPLSASISPLSASILVGQSVTFTSTVSGGYTPYTYQWYLNDTAVSGATMNSWNFTPIALGTYFVHLGVTDAYNSSVQSEIARIVCGASASDVNRDGKVDLRDISLVAIAFGSYPGHPRWNLIADINQDGKIDLRDIALVARNFGKTYS